MSALVKTMVTVLLAFGITGGTVATSATNSLPDSTLYPVKLALEEARLALNRDAAGQVETHLILAQYRLEEMEQMMARGEMPDDAVRTRLESHLRQAVSAAAAAPEKEMAGLLTRIRDRVQEQSETMTRLQKQGGETGQAALGQTLREMARLRQECEFGMNEPQQFRWEYQHGQIPTERPCAAADCEPAGAQHQYGPTPEQGFGPGQRGGSSECPNGECEPAGEQNQYGPAPEEGFGPGEPGGNPECPAGDCEPAGDEHKYGPQPAEGAGPGQPGGNPDCLDCEPAVDQHQYGPQPEEKGEFSPPADHQECPSGGCEQSGDPHQKGH